MKPWGHSIQRHPSNEKRAGWATSPISGGHNDDDGGTGWWMAQEEFFIYRFLQHFTASTINKYVIQQSTWMETTLETQRSIICRCTFTLHFTAGFFSIPKFQSDYWSSETETWSGFIQLIETGQYDVINPVWLLDKKDQRRL
jgi:hypothetical protein